MSHANFNVTTLLNTSAALQERYVYEPYGVRTIWDDDWSENPSTTKSNALLFCGAYYDCETGIYYVRNRMYHAQVGRWLQRDPEGYVDGMSLYEYCRSGPIIGADPMGLEGWGETIIELDPLLIPWHIYYVVQDANFHRELDESMERIAGEHGYESKQDMASTLDDLHYHVWKDTDVRPRHTVGDMEKVAAMGKVVKAGAEVDLAANSVAFSAAQTSAMAYAAARRPVEGGAASLGARGAAAPAQKHPSTPVGRGREGAGMHAKGNVGATVEGVHHKPHAVDSMQSRGIPPSAVENTVKHGNKMPPRDGTISVYHDPVNNVTVATECGRVMGVRKGKPCSGTPLELASHECL